MSEWSNEHDWKSCIRHKRIGGSNPPLSATLKHPWYRVLFAWLRSVDLPFGLPLAGRKPLANPRGVFRESTKVEIEIGV